MHGSHDLPRTKVMVHRVMSGHFDRCLNIMQHKPPATPFVEWVAAREGREREFYRYVLSSGFRKGRVMIAKPRVGICVIIRRGRSWSPALKWARLRMLYSLSAKQRQVLAKAEAALDSKVPEGGVVVKYLTADTSAGGERIERKLLHQSLAPYSGGPIHLYGPLTGLPAVIEERVTEIARTDLPGMSKDLRLYRIELENLQECLK